jgi:hypothetical protein
MSSRNNISNIYFLALAALTPTLLLTSGCSEETKRAPTPYEEISGRWESNCAEGKNFALTAKTNLGITQTSQLEINLSEVKETTVISSRKCDSRDIEIKTISKATIEAPAGVQYRDLDLQVSSYSILPLTEFGARILNLSKWCGFSDWAVGTDRDVTIQAAEGKCMKPRGARVPFVLEGANLKIETAEPANPNFNSGNGNTPASAPQTPATKTEFFFTRI